MANILTYNQVVDILRDIAERHYLINTFVLGRDWELENERQDLVYPVLQVYPESSRMPYTSNGDYKTLEFNIVCKVLDIVQQSENDEKDVHSDTLRVAQDIVNELNQHPFYVRSNAQIVGDINFTNLEEFEDDFTAGWEFSITIRLININNFCGLPIEDITGYSAAGPVYTGYSTSVQYLTCETVTGCTSVGAALNGGTYIQSSSTISFTTVGGNTYEISGITSGGGGDTYWTSGSSGSYSIKTINNSGLDATGNYAVAEGRETLASGAQSHAEGYSTEAIGANSHAEGLNTIASGTESHAEGNSTTASGAYSHSEGLATLAAGTASHAGGYLSNSIGYASFVHGSGSIANANYSVVFGRNITGNTADTTYVDGLNIKTIGSGTSITSLGIDANGFVVSGSSGSLSSVTGLTSGLISGGTVTINSLDNTKIDIAAGSAVIVDFWTTIGTPVEYRFSWSAQTGVSVTYLTSNTQSYIAIDKNALLAQYSSYPSNSVRRDHILLAQLGHAAKTNVASVNAFISAYDSPIEEFRDIIREFKLINAGNTISANGSNLKINKSSGTLFGMGINFRNDVLNPNRISISGYTQASFRYRTQTGGTTSPVSDIDPTKYDVGGVITSIGAGPNAATNQRVYLFPNGNLVIQYGQTVYTNLTAAIAAVQYESFTAFENVSDSAILIGIISLRNGATNLSLSTDARFIPVSKLGENLGGTAGISTTTLQLAYNNSAEPEIVTDSTLGAVTIKDGTGTNNANQLEIKNSAGTITAFITSQGGLSATSITASTYYNIPTVFGTGANNNGGTITTGVTGYFVAGHAGRITGWELIGATSGSIVFDIWKTTGSTLPTVANSITDAAKPRITAGVYSGSTNLSAWSGLTYNAGDKFGFNIDSVSGFTTATLTIKGFKSN